MGSAPQIEPSRRDLSDWIFLRQETIGQSPTLWLREPGGPPAAASEWLFKPVLIHVNGTRQTGDLAEKIVSELARRVEIPHADIELAQYKGLEGSISRNVRPNQHEMHTGRIWMNAHPAIEYQAINARKSRRRGSATEGYSLPNILRSLEDVSAPEDNTGREESAAETFTDYLVLDALVANRDRHEDNWAITKPIIGPGPVRLAALYDNAGSLGYNMSDDARERVLAKPDGIATWVRRGTAWRFDGHQNVSLVDLAIDAEKMIGRLRTSSWPDKLENLISNGVGDFLARMPGMSEVSRRFALEVIVENAGRIRDGYRNATASA